MVCMRRLLLTIWLCSCGSLIPVGSSRSATCLEANTEYRIWRGIGIVCEVFAGATATGGLITRSVTDEPYADIVLGGSSVLFTGCSALSGFMSGEAAEDATSECNEPTTFTSDVVQQP